LTLAISFWVSENTKLSDSDVELKFSLTGLDMVVRDESGSILDITSTSTTELYEHHMQAIERIRLAVGDDKLKNV
jgi:hypothetical protein